MKVVIVAKTRMGGGACIGAITFEGRSLRLIAADQQWNDQFNQEYHVGEVWDVDCVEPEALTPPHVENVVVQRKRRLPPIDDVTSFVQCHMPPRSGGVDVLFEGLTCATSTGSLYIAQESGVPPYSTMFWQPDKPLQLDDDGKRLRYRYPGPGAGCTLTFVGFQDPLPEIPAGTIVRVSLAHWWRPDDKPEDDLRCYVQLSGWLVRREEPAPDTADTTVHLPAAAVQMPSFAQSPHALLKEVFGFDDFRSMQEDIVEQVLAKEDTLAVMPTGSGKSLCYQLPALLFPGLTVVVSPLISLMEDQVAQLRELGIPALYLNSTLRYDEYLAASRLVRAGRVKLLYAAPETLLRPETLHLLDQANVDCLTIDEAHCISEWGHDFRPEYRQLVEVRRRLPEAVCLAVTATATQQVREDIKNSLQIPDAQAFVASFNRDNLFLSVEPKSDGLAQTIAFLQDHGEAQSGIIYCATRRQVDVLTEELTARGWDALPYHAGLDDETRRLHQRRFSRDDTPIIVATIAFGMGINKSNVRFVLHYDLPKNIDSYYQQIGRAGRDGLRADCLLLYSYSDVSTINYFIHQQAPDQQRGAQMRLEAMLSFVETSGCRRSPLLAYFGETYGVDNCGLCDNCTVERRDLVDLTVAAQKFLSCVKRTGEIFGTGHVVDVLRGSRAQTVLSRGHDRLSTYDIGGEYSAREWKQLARQFVDQGLLVRDMQHGSLKLTSKAYAVFRGEQVFGTPPSSPRRASRTAEREYDVELFELLRAKRKELADGANVPAFAIFSDRSLAEMATYFPQSEASFAQIHGVGQHKLDHYATAFLPIIRQYCAENGIREARRKVNGSRARNRQHANRTDEVASRFNSGQSVGEIAETFGVRHSTVINHLWKAVQSGQRLANNDLLAESSLSSEEQQRVVAAFEAQGLQFLRPVYEALDQEISYDELHLIRLHLAIRSASP